MRLKLKGSTMRLAEGTGYCNCRFTIGMPFRRRLVCGRLNWRDKHASYMPCTMDTLRMHVHVSAEPTVHCNSGWRHSSASPSVHTFQFGKKLHFPRLNHFPPRADVSRPFSGQSAELSVHRLARATASSEVQGSKGATTCAAADCAGRVCSGRGMDGEQRRRVDGN